MFPRVLGALVLCLALTPALSAQLAIRAYPVEGIEYKPMPVVFMVADRGSVEEATIELTNRREEPLEILGIENPSERFDAKVEEIEPGRRYRFIVELRGEGAVGKQQDVVSLKTSFKDAPDLRIPVNTAVRERVYTFPQTVFMGRYPLSEIDHDAEAARAKSQILMVYRKRTTDFEIKVSSDIPFLKIHSERGPNGDRWENTFFYDVEKAVAGPVKGTILIETNDPEISRLEVPIWGDLQP